MPLILTAKAPSYLAPLIALLLEKQDIFFCAIISGSLGVKRLVYCWLSTSGRASIPVAHLVEKIRFTSRSGGGTGRKNK